jgi:hypothetical protein
MCRSGCYTHIMTEVANPCMRLLTSMGGWLHALLSNSSLMFDFCWAKKRAHNTKCSLDARSRYSSLWRQRNSKYSTIEYGPGDKCRGFASATERFREPPSLCTSFDFRRARSRRDGLRWRRV